MLQTRANGLGITTVSLKEFLKEIVAIKKVDTER